MIVQATNFLLKINKMWYHILFWLMAYFFWVFIFRNGTLVLTRAITIQFCYLIFIAANYYFNALYAIPYLLNKQKYVKLGVCFILGITLTAIMRVPVSVFVNTHIFNQGRLPFNYFSIFCNSFVNIIFWVLVILTGKMIAEKIRSQLYIEQIEKEKSANELNFLRAQFNPHFLFNSINSIYGYIDKSNKDARKMLLVFSEMLRYQLYECNVDFIDLDRELNYIQNYIAIQKSRIDERIAVKFYIGNIDGHVKIAPFLLISFIENAFKYIGFNENRQNKIEINLTYNNGTIFFTIMNTKDAFVNQLESSSGLGIANAKRRLELLYPFRHELTILEKDDRFEVILILADVAN
jgi:two-component system LytT family sensor kinase